MMKRWMGILPLAILAGCSGPSPEELVGPIEEQVGVGLALNKDCGLLNERQYSVLFAYVTDTFGILEEGRFNDQIARAQTLEKDFGCQSPEVEAIARVPVMMYSLNEQAKQATGEGQGQDTSTAVGGAAVPGEGEPQPMAESAGGPASLQAAEATGMPAVAPAVPTAAPVAVPAAGPGGEPAVGAGQEPAVTTTTIEGQEPPKVESAPALPAAPAGQ